MNSKLFNKFAKDRNIKESTRQGYESAIDKYTTFHNLTIDELIDEALNEENNHIPLKKRKIKSRLLDFRTFLINSELSPSSVRTYFSKITTFYRHFEVEMPFLPQAKFNKTYEVNYLDLPTKAHIAQAVEISPVSFKAIILFMASSGTAKAETLSLTVKDFINATSEYHSGGSIDDILAQLKTKNNVIPTFYLKRIKTDKYYYTFCSPEATKYIIAYLKTRSDLDFNDKLFDFTSSKLMSNFQQINDKLNWGFKGKSRFFRSHTLRKFHASNIGLSAEYIDSLQGRGKNTVHDTYIKTNPVKLKEIYQSVVENVEIFPKENEENVTQEFNIIINVFLAGKEYNLI